MASWKTVVSLLILLVGVITFINETEAGRTRQTKLSYQPPRLRDYVKVKNEYYKKPGDKKKRLRSEIIAAGNKFVVKVPNPPIILDQVLEYWPYHRVYVTSILGIINYIHKISWIAYKILWIFIDMFVLLVKIVFQATEITKLRHSYDELSKPHPFNFHHEDHHDHDDY